MSRSKIDETGSESTWLRSWGLMLVVAVAHWATARLGLLFAMPGGHVTVIWPPSGCVAWA